jgi:hypothetical protein
MQVHDRVAPAVGRITRISAASLRDERSGRGDHRAEADIPMGRSLVAERIVPPYPAREGCRGAVVLLKK